MCYDGHAYSAGKPLRRMLRISGRSCGSYAAVATSVANAPSDLLYAFISHRATRVIRISIVNACCNEYYVLLRRGSLASSYCTLTALTRSQCPDEKSLNLFPAESNSQDVAEPVVRHKCTWCASGAEFFVVLHQFKIFAVTGRLCKALM